MGIRIRDLGLPKKADSPQARVHERRAAQARKQDKQAAARREEKRAHAAWRNR